MTKIHLMPGQVPYWGECLKCGHRHIISARNASHDELAAHIAGLSCDNCGHNAAKISDNQEDTRTQKEKTGGMYGRHNRN